MASKLMKGDLAKMEEELEQRIKQLHEYKKNAMLGGGEDKLAQQREKGKLNARERIDRLLDPGSFVELNMLVGHASGAPGDGVVVGHGTIDGRTVCIYSQDPTVLGGSIGALHGHKMYTMIESALDMGVPLIGLHDSPGARTARISREPRESEPGEARGLSEKSGSSTFFPNTQASGVIPQIAAILGSCAGISVYSPALNDFIYMVEGLSHMFITGPRIVKSVMGEDLTMEELGGAKIHSQKSGVADFRVKSEDECFQSIRALLSYLPPSNKEKPPRKDTGDDPNRMDDVINEIVPTNPSKSYDMHRVIKGIVDNGEFLEVKKEFAGEMIVGFAHLDGYPTGIVANQPMVRAGSLTVDSSDKQARFIRFCDSFNIPLVFLVDTPAYQPGSYQEHAGIIRHGAKVLYSLCESVVPRVNILIRKCYGGGSLGMGVVPGMQADFNFAWPIFEQAVMGAQQTVDLFYGQEIAKAENPEQLREKLTKEYRDRSANPFGAVSSATNIQDVIEPKETRPRLIQAFKLLRTKDIKRYPKRHGNIPL